MRIVGVAATNQNGIGYKGNIPFKSVLDRAIFKTLTKSPNSAVVYGRLTYESMGRQLPDRYNILISTTIHSDIATVRSIPEAIKHAREQGITTLYVIGGARIYSGFLGYYDEFYLTIIPGDEQCDVNIFDTITALDWSFTSTSIQFPEMQLRKYNGIRDVRGPTKEAIQGALSAPSMRDSRTGTNVRIIHNLVHEYDLHNSALGNHYCIMPATSLRKQALRSIFYETLWYILGRTDLQYLHERKVHVWDANYEAKHGIPATTPGASVGATYGYYWRNFNGVDQLGEIITSLREGQYHRRLVLTQWDPSNIDKCVLPPCILNYTFSVGADKRLNLMVAQRSNDIITAMNWNVCQAAFLTHLICATVNMKPGKLTFCVANAHIYENQEDIAAELITRRERPYPLIKVAPREDIEKYEWSDITIVNYYHGGAVNIGKIQV